MITSRKRCKIETYSCDGRLIIGSRMWPIECYHCQCHWMTLKVTFAVRNLYSSHSSWNSRNLLTQRVARSLCGSWASCFHNQACIHWLRWFRWIRWMLYCLSNAILTDYLITLVSVRVCVCVCVCPQIGCRTITSAINSLPIFTKFCMPLRNVVVSNAIVSGTNRK